MNLRRDDGMVTAEAATALPVLVLVAVFAVAVVLTAGQHTRLVDAAHVAALAAARGDDDQARVLAARLAPGAAVAISATGDTVTVTVSEMLGLGPVHGPRVSVTAVAPVEPDPAAGAAAASATAAEP